MNILFCWTGVTSYMADCWRELAKRDGVDLRIVIERTESGSDFRAEETLKGLRVELVDDGNELEVGVRVREWNPDIIFAGGWRSKVTRRVLAAYPKVPKVFCLDMPWRWQLRCIAARFALWSFLRQFQAIYVPGELAAKYARWLGFKPHQIVKGLYAVDQKRLRAPTTNNQQPTTNTPKGFLFVGRHSPVKRRDLVEAAYKRYRELGGTWSIDYYGQGGKFAQAAEMPGVYASHACLVLASAFDPWPLVALEARSAGLQVIASDRCGNADELGAIKVKFGDIEATAKAMLEVEKGRFQAVPELSAYTCCAWAKRVCEIVASYASERM